MSEAHNRIWGYWRFYTSFAAVSICTTLIAILYYIILDDPTRSIVSIKLLTWAVCYLFITKARAGRLIFYYNLAYRPIWLWSFSIAFDVLILLLSLTITHYLK